MSKPSDDNEEGYSADKVDLQSDGKCALKDRLLELESQVEQLQLVNAGQKSQIDRLQKDRIRKSILPQTKPLVYVQENQSDDVESSDDSMAKLEQFFKIFNTKSISASQLSIHAINSLVSLHQILYTKEDTQSQNFTAFSQSSSSHNTSEKAAKIAFNYVLEFMRQLNVSKLDSQSKTVDVSYPISWLLSLFPYNVTDGPVSDLLWMPLHFAVALDSSTSLFEASFYLQDVEILLAEFGQAAFEEDVSPLSVAVSLAQPNLDLVKLILEFRPESVSKPDEDGSLPLMHACANNTSLEVIEYLYDLYPEALQVTDSFGCAAIHYAAFYGCADTVSYLARVDPACVHMVEGNGALPLHDAVQNQRDGESTEMVEFLLQINASAVRKRDDYGAFPLHKAAKSSTLAVVKMVHAAFPKAIFGADIEGLLPMHYCAERVDKDHHYLDVMQYVLQANPSSQVIEDDALLFAVEPDPTSAGAAGWRGAIRSMWGAAKPTAPAATSTRAQGVPVPSTSAGANASGSGSGGKSVVHNKRKSVRPVRGSIHEQYKR